MVLKVLPQTLCHGAAVPPPSVSTHISSSIPLTPARGPGHVLPLRWNNKCTSVGPPLFLIVFIGRHLPQETIGPTNRCVTEKESVCEWVWGRGCPRSLVTICLRWSSCQLLFLSVIQHLTLSTCSLQSHDMTCNLSGEIYIQRVGSNDMQNQPHCDYFDRYCDMSHDFSGSDNSFFIVQPYLCVLQFAMSVFPFSSLSEFSVYICVSVSMPRVLTAGLCFKVH